MKDIDALINELATEAKPLPTPATLSRVVAMWVIGIVLYISSIFVSGLYGLRPDIFTVLAQPLFTLEISALALLILSTVIAAAVLSFPDSYQKPALVYIPVAVFVLFVVILGIEWMYDSSPTTFSFSGVECLACITGLSLLPAIDLLYKIRHLATTSPNKACALAVLCSFSVGAFILRLNEQTNSISHVVVWHYAPILAVGLAGLWAGPRLLKW